MASFVLRGVDTALWTAAREACKAEGVPLVTIVERYLVQWLSGGTTIAGEGNEESIRVTEDADER